MAYKVFPKDLMNIINDYFFENKNYLSKHNNNVDK